MIRYTGRHRHRIPLVALDYRVKLTYDFVGHSAAKTAFTLPHWI